MAIWQRLVMGMTAFAVIVYLSASPALAQNAPAPPPQNDRVEIDENGVDVLRRSYVESTVDVTIGSGDGQLSLGRITDTSRDVGSRENNFIMYPRTDYDIYLIFNSDGTKRISFSSRDIDIAVDDSSTFGQLINTSGQPSIFRTNDGTEYVFGHGINFTGPYREFSMAAVTEIRRPNGHRTTITWQDAYDYELIGEACCMETQTDVYTRILSVSNNYGFQLKFSYISNDSNRWDGSDHITTGEWTAVQRVAGLNNFYERVDQNSEGNTSAGEWPYVIYAFAPGSLTTTRSDGVVQQITNTLQSGLATQTTITTNGSQTAQANYAFYSPTIGLTYLSSITIAGVTTNYSVPGAVTTPLSSFTIGTTYRSTPAGTTDSTTYTFNSDFSRVVSVARPGGLNTGYAYDSMSRLQETTLPEGNRVRLSYDMRSNIIERRLIAKPSSGLADIVYTAGFPASCTANINCNRPSWTRDALGNQTDYTYSSTTGLMTAQTLPAAASGGIRPEVRNYYSQRTATYRNDANVLVTGSPSIATLDYVATCPTAATCPGAANEQRSNYASYNHNLTPTVLSVSSGNNAISMQQSVELNQLGLVNWIDGPLPGSADRTSYVYDTTVGFSRLRGTIGPDPDGAGPRLHVAERFTYDTLGRRTKVERGNVAVVSEAALVSMTALQTLDTTYDSSGRLVRQQQSSGATIFAVNQSSYDSRGRTRCVATRMNPAVWASQTDACIANTAGASGPDRIGRISYDALGRTTLLETGVGTTIASTEVATAYTANGQVSHVVDGENNRTTYVYDGHDRLSRTRYPVTTRGANSSSTTDYEELTYDANSRFTNRRLRDNQNIGMAYDNLSRLTYRNLPGSEPDVSLTYDLTRRITQAITSASQFAGFAYDALGRMTAQSNNQGVLGMGYDAAGRRTLLVYPDNFYVTYDYDVIGNVTAIRENGATSGVGVLSTYAYDSLGRRSTVTFGNGTAQTLTHDNADRLTTLSNDLASTANDMSMSFTYNPASQIATLTRNNDAYAWTQAANLDRTDTINGLNQITLNGLTSVTYDSRGNLAARGSSSWTYNADNLMLTGPSGTLSWDPLGRLNTLTATGQAAASFAYDGINMVAEYVGSAMTHRYVHGPGTDDPIVWYVGSGTTDRRFLMADERGSIVSISNASGALIAINSYDEYGVPSTSNTGRFQYTGQQWLPEIGLYHYRARMYSPTLGRFMQTDPIGYADGMNWYAYVGDDPINFVDPLGLQGAELRVTGPTCGQNPSQPRCRQPDNSVRDRYNYQGQFGSECDRARVGAQGDTLDRCQSRASSNPQRLLDVAQNDQCSAPPISSAEAAASRRGDRRAFWSSRAARGDPLGDTALSIVGDSDFSGVYANSRLRGAIFARNRAENAPLSFSAAQIEVQQIGVELMRAHVNAVRTFGNPSAAQIASYHFQVFNAHRLPNRTFGGSMFTGTEEEATALQLGWLGC